MSTAAVVVDSPRFCVVRGSATDEDVAALAGVFAALATSAQVEDSMDDSGVDESGCRLVGTGPRRPWRRARTREPLRAVRRDPLQLSGSGTAVRTAAARWAAQR
jgi:hypothetical protein